MASFLAISCMLPGRGRPENSRFGCDVIPEKADSALPRSVNFARAFANGEMYSVVHSVISGGVSGGGTVGRCGGISTSSGCGNLFSSLWYIII
mmetsp:Transcript_77120/g.115999  ORF Transcript_77120/g.115999 Transcript_77120/m.115999 type:complete len:93 (-) Transcript_77120:68-346(-)